MSDDPIDFARIRRVRRRIDALEARLEQAHAERLQLVQVMTEHGMRQREIGAYWGITNPRVSQMLKKSARETA